MKKNLLSILILVLLIVNIVLTTVMMISVTGTNDKTAKLVASISTALNLELHAPGQEVETAVSLADTETYDLSELMIPLTSSGVVNEDGTVSSTKQSYIVFTLSLLQNKEHEDYGKLGGSENMKARESLVSDVVTRVVGGHTLQDCQTNLDAIREEILKEIQQLFGSDFIYRIGLSGIKYG